MQIRRWNEAKLDTNLAADLAEACEIHPFLSLLLTAQGYDTPESIFSFLVGSEEEVDRLADHLKETTGFATVEAMAEAIQELMNTAEIKN